VEALGFVIRPALTADLGSIISMKRQLAIADDAEHAVRASHADWLRDCFGPEARFRAYVADVDAASVGMVVYSERAYTGWCERALYVQDLFVMLPYRRRGIARSLLARVAADALALRSPMVELTVRANNPANEFYRRTGFEPVEHCVNYVAAGGRLARLADGVGQTMAASRAAPLAP
jgi:ribosomal protein S18 acetylase RimI-like enzyme